MRARGPATPASLHPGPTTTTMKQQPAAASAGVPAFLSKLWALLGEAPSNQLITWSQVGAPETGSRPPPPGKRRVSPPPPAHTGR